METRSTKIETASDDRAIDAASSETEDITVSNRDASDQADADHVSDMTSPEVIEASTDETVETGRRFDYVSVLLVAILTIALLLRTSGIDWDQGGLFHPDERDFLLRAERLDFSQLAEPEGLFSIESRLNPAWFNYGSLPLYALSGFRTVARVFTDSQWDFRELRIPGRLLAAIADTITVLVVYLLATRLFGDRRIGLLAALLSALAVIQIQNAHYTAVDGPMTMFIVATIYFSTRLVQERRPRDAVLAGAMFGFALATKFTASTVALSVGTAYLLLLFGPRVASASATRLDRDTLRQVLIYALMTGGAALAAFLVTQPYTLVDWKTLVGNVSTQSEMVRRIVDFPFTRQYVDTPAFWYQIRQLSTWGLGISLGIAVWVGLVWAIIRTFAKRDLALMVMLAFLIPYLIINGQFEVKFLRYMLPATPLLIVCAAGAIWWIYATLVPRLHRSLRYVPYAVSLIAFVLLAHYTIAYLNVFSGPHPAQDVSRWLRDNAPAGTVVIQEHWEEGIPNLYDLRMHETLPMYDPDNAVKFTQVARLMENADYFVLYSNRLAATIPRLPERYPSSSRFYELLFTGELGYKLAYSSVRVPAFMGVVYWDDPYARVPFSVPAGYRQPRGDLYNWDWYGWADESFTVYEHPHALVFENVEKASRDELIRRIYDGHDPNLVGAFRFASTEVGLVYDDAQAETQRSGDSWNTIYFLRDLPNEMAWMVWLLAVQIISLAALPLTYVIFRPLTDRGYFFSKPLGILLVATFAWLMASVGVLGFSAFSVGGSILLLAFINLLILWRLRDEIVAYAKAHWKTFAIAEVIFLVAFLAFLAIRLANPDLWHAWRGGEKPMDFAYLNAVTRSTIMPPYDPWFAGGYLNYYYYGQFIIASLIRITGIVPTVAYNLAVPLIFALSFTAVYTIAYNLVAMTMRARGRIRLGSAPIMFGIIAAMLAFVAANIDGLIQVIGGFYGALLHDQAFPNFDYWRSTRLFDYALGGNEITEFPFFTFLYADLHAHMIAIPFAVLALGLTITAFLRAGMQRLSKFETLGVLIILGIVVGSLRLINSWDYPTQLLLVAGFIFIGEMWYGHRGLFIGIAQAVAKTAIVGIVGYLVYLPFHTNFELFNNGIEASKFQTALWRYLLIHSIFLFIIASWLIVEWRRGTFRFKSILEIVNVGYGYPKWTPIAIAGVVGILALAIAVTYPPFVTAVIAFVGALLLAFTLLIAYLRRHPEQRYMLIIIAMSVMALMIAIGVDLITVKNDIGRQNTIFKFYIQAWWMLAIVAAYALWRLWDLGALSLRVVRVPRVAWLVVFAILTVGVFIYPVMATEVRLDDRFNIIGPGIDGEAYMDDAVYQHSGATLDLGSDLPGINWLRENVEGSPVVAEGNWNLYTWSNRVSIYTGLPTVIGWDWHQTQQRHDYRWEVERRRTAVNNFYSTGDVDEARAFLDEFDVKYVYIGELERVIYPSRGIDKFDDYSELNLRPVFQEGTVTIYEYHG